MQGISALFPMEVPDTVLVKAMTQAFRLQQGEIFLYADLEDLSVMEGRAVAVLCRNFRLNEYFPSAVELLFRDQGRVWDHSAFLKALCTTLDTWCLFEDATLEGVNPYEFYRMDRSGMPEKGLVIPALLISDEEMAELSASEVAEVEQERRVYSKRWWRPG